MLTNLRIVESLSMLAVLCGVHRMPVLAQATAPTTWETNQQNAINQDPASGLINSKQAFKWCASFCDC